MCWIHCVFLNNRAEMWKKKTPSQLFLFFFLFFTSHWDCSVGGKTSYIHMDNFSQSLCFPDSFSFKLKLAWDKVAFMIKKCFACGTLDEVTFSLILKDSFLTLTHMVKCALMWCRFSLSTFMLFFSLSAFSCSQHCGWREGFFLFRFLTMGFPFLSIFFTMLVWKTCRNGMGNDWWIRERREKSFTVHEDSSSHVFSLFRFLWKGDPAS